MNFFFIIFASRHDIAEILLKLVLSSNQSINQLINHAYGIRMSRTYRMRMKAYDIPLMKMISTDNNQPLKPMSMVTIFVTLPTPII